MLASIFMNVKIVMKFLSPSRAIAVYFALMVIWLARLCKRKKMAGAVNAPALATEVKEVTESEIRH